MSREITKQLYLLEKVTQEDLDSLEAYNEKVFALFYPLLLRNHSSQLVTLEKYNAKLLNDFGGGDVEWWHSYIRDELNRAYEWYEAQVQGV